MVGNPFLLPPVGAILSRSRTIMTVPPRPMHPQLDPHLDADNGRHRELGGINMGLSTAVATLMMAAALHTGVAPVTLTPARATLAPVPTGDYLFPHCGDRGWRDVCHMAIYSRHYTKFVMAPAASSTTNGATTVASLACAGLAGPAGAVCGIPVAAIGWWSSGAIAQAAAQNTCVAIDQDPTGIAYFFATYNGPRCHDN